MAFEVFKKRVSAIVSKAGASVRFHHEDDGRHFAHCSDGVTIIGNLSSPSVCVKWEAATRPMSPSDSRCFLLFLLLLSLPA